MSFLAPFFRENALWILLTLATLVSFLWIMKFREKLKIAWYASLIIAVLHTAVGVVFVKLFAFLESIGEETHGNMSLFGAVFALPAVYVIASLVFKRKMSDVFDIFTMATVATLFFARVNCFIGDCCLGIELANGVRVPTRELELVYYFVMINVLYVTVQKDKLFGRAYPLFMLSYGVFRFVIEFFREAEKVYFGAFHLAHLWALISFATGLCFFIVLTKKHTDRKKIKNKNK